MAAAATARTGGRTQQGSPPANPAVRHAYGYPVRPSQGKPPPGPAGAVPRSGGRTQQGARTQPRTGGRTQQGTQDGAEVQPAPPAQDQGQGQGTVTTRQPGRGGGDAGGALLALFGYPLLLAMLRGGPARARQWLAAKFVNQVPGQPATGPDNNSGRWISLPGVPARHVPVLGPNGRRPL